MSSLTTSPRRVECEQVRRRIEFRVRSAYSTFLHTLRHTSYISTTSSAGRMKRTRVNELCACFPPLGDRFNSALQQRLQGVCRTTCSCHCCARSPGHSHRFCGLLMLPPAAECSSARPAEEVDKAVRPAPSESAKAGRGCKTSAILPNLRHWRPTSPGCLAREAQGTTLGI